MKRSVPTLLLGVTLCGCGTVARNASIPLVPGNACTLTEIERTVLTLPGGEDIYVAPVALATNQAGERFLSGTPNYLYRRGPDGAQVEKRADSLMAVIVDAVGRTSIVPGPIDSRRITHVRARARADGGWDVVFAEKREARPDRVEGEINPIVGAWAGRFSISEGWRDLQSLPLPAGYTLSSASRSVSDLVGDSTLQAWAVVAAPGVGLNAVVVFLRVGGAWSAEVPARNGAWSPHLALDAEGRRVYLGYLSARPLQDGNGLVQAVFATVRRESWSEPTPVDPGIVESEVQAFRFLDRPGGVPLAWTESAGDAVRLLEIPDLREPGQPSRLQTLPGHHLRFSGVTISDSTWAWLGIEPRSGMTEGGVLRAIVSSRQGVVATAEVSVPFPIPVVAASAGRGTFDVAGPLITAGLPGFPSLLMRYRLDCRRTAA